MLGTTLTSSTRAVAVTVLIAASLTAQGGITWPGLTSNPKAYLVRVDAHDYDVYVPGFVTYPSPGTDADEYVGAGLGTGSGSVRDVDKTEFKNEATGKAAQKAELFPFRRDGAIGTAFDALTPTQNLRWTGFLAKADGPVRGFRGGSLCFKFRPTSSIDPVLFRQQIASAMVGVAIARQNSTLVSGSRLFVLDTDLEPAELMYYKFDRMNGDIAVNYVDEFAGGPRAGDLTSANNTHWTTGKFRGAMRGGDAQSHTSCDTRWTGGLYGSFTIAWFMRQRNTPGAMTSRFFIGPGPLRCYTNGSAGKGIQLDGWSGNKPGLTLNKDVQQMAANGWVHVALVVDVATQRARWFVDGVGEPVISLNDDAFLPVAGGLVIGGAPGDPNFYDIDEFRLWAEAMPAALITSWAQRSTPANGRHGDPTGCALRTRGRPVLGNSNYAFHVLGRDNLPAGIVIGAPAAIPFPFATGNVYVDPIAVHIKGNTGVNGVLTWPAGIPNNPSFKGFLLYSQGYVVRGSKLLLSNAQATSIH